MNKYEEHFGQKKTLICVVHTKNAAQAVESTTVALDNGADGVFLIGQTDTGAILSSGVLVGCYESVRWKHPKAWIGMNCLDLPDPSVFFGLPDDCNGCWSDYSGVDDTGTVEAKRYSGARRGSGWNGLYFGGVAFKGQDRVTDLKSVARAATEFMDVVTTSGPSTGERPTVEKIATMRRAVGDHPLAIASGMTPDNVWHYLNYADCFIVATGVSRSFHEFDPKLVNAFARAIE